MHVSLKNGSNMQNSLISPLENEKLIQSALGKNLFCFHFVFSSRDKNGHYSSENELYAVAFS
jgi:hypothetical protein